MIELMKQLCALPGPSGCEDAVREFVLEKVKPFADEMKTDAIGNIMAVSYTHLDVYKRQLLRRC